jgi:glycogen debranching enzyme
LTPSPLSSARRRAATGSQQRSWEDLPDVFGDVEDISDALITREQHQFLLTDPSGNVPAQDKSGLGFYSRDTRHLSIYDFLLDGLHPMVLLSTADSGFSQEQILGNHRMVQDGRVVGRCTVELSRQRVLNGNLEERLRITNYNSFPVTVRPTYQFGADFADIFEIRGHQREKKGTFSPPDVTDKSISYRYFGADGVWRWTTIVFDLAPAEMSAEGAAFVVSLGPRDTVELSFRILLQEHSERHFPDGLKQLRREYSNWHDSFTNIHTDNEGFNHVLNRSLTDLRMLWTKDPHGQGFFAAGTPWFSTLFGRDSIITSLQTLPFRPELARECLALLARHQGQSLDPYRSEEPGKILHEAREDELSVIGELPYQRYYGSVDSTPLFLLLAAEYFHWTGDREVLISFLPSINAALQWLGNHRDHHGDGFLQYETDSPAGLRNQGWKDSAEGIMHADGRLCEGPIALAEVQGYVYAAYVRLAAVFDSLGDPTQATQLRNAAAALRRRFNRDFWLPKLNRVALALDGDKKPSEVMSSNAGQVLWSGILSHERAALVRDALFQNDMFSGWGIRTLSSASKSYYPLGYHVGTVWPHDNGMIALGLKRYGFDNEVNELSTALFDASREFPSFRLPELFGGQPRSEYQPPVPYPVACRPQAWTAGAMLHLLQAMLGLYPDAASERLNIIRPRLPYWLREVHISGLRVGRGHVDLHFSTEQGATSVAVETRGRVTVVTSSSWRSFISPT